MDHLQRLLHGVSAMNRDLFRIYVDSDFGLAEHRLTELTLSQANAYVAEQISKCHRKMSTGDYDGVITNARTLLEKVLRTIEEELNDHPPAYDGDLVKLNKRVMQLLQINIDKSTDSTIKQMINGLISVTNGLAGLRNRMSDAHAVQQMPDVYHARLALQSAITVADFLVSVIQEQEHRTAAS